MNVYEIKLLLKTWKSQIAVVQATTFAVCVYLRVSVLSQTHCQIYCGNPLKPCRKPD